MASDDTISLRVANNTRHPIGQPKPPLQLPKDFPLHDLIVNVGLALKGVQVNVADAKALPAGHERAACGRRAAETVMVGRSRAAVILLLLAWATVAASSTVHANGRVVTFETLEAGPYEISVGTIPKAPSVGAFHITMTVADASTNTYLLDAVVTVTGVGPNGAASEIGPLAATASLRDPSFYEANLSVDREGTWVFTIGVAGELGEASADFAVEVRQAAPLVGIASFLALIALLAIVGLSVRAYFRKRRAGSG